ncbi:MAG: hypothetical protein CMF24_08765 [Ilumatobacter sp.]|nr:hypothetical protein [Ilumatobacter sp.]
MSVLRAWFYAPRGDTRHWLNDLVAALDGPFAHCELQFEGGEASSIYHGTTARLVAREFDRAFYTLLTLPCTRAQHDRALASARAAVGTPFSSLAMTNAYLGLPLAPSGTFCSKLNADALVAAGVLAPRDTRGITPSALHRALAPPAPRALPAPHGPAPSAPLDWAHPRPQY